MKKYFLPVIFTFIFSQSFSQSKKLLIIGIDGCRADVIKKHFAPTIDSIIHLNNTASSSKMKNETHTMSAPNWSSMLTGVHWEKHKAKNNRSFKKGRFDKYPIIYKYLKQDNPEFKSAAYATWKDLNEYLFSNNTDYAPKEENVSDSLVVNKVLEWYDTNNVNCFDASFIQLDAVDHAGHAYKFSPKNMQYTNAITETDKKVKTIFEAIEKRKKVFNEDWLIIITTDHGGRRTGGALGHCFGIFNTHIRNVFLIMNGNKVKPGKIRTPQTVDIAYTILKYFGKSIKPSWHLAGKSVGLKK